MKKVARVGDYIKSPAVPLVILMGGHFFYLGFLYFANIQGGSTLRTGAFFGLLYLYVFISSWRHWRCLRVQTVDLLFACFVILLLLSLMIHENRGQERYLQFLPFFVVFPYLAGRLCSSETIKQFIFGYVWITWGALILIAPWLLERLNDSVPPELRPYIFGVGQTSIYAGQLVGGVLTLLVSYLLLQRNWGVLRWAMAGLMFLLVTSLIILTARGPLMTALATIAIALATASWARPRQRALMAGWLAACVVLAIVALPPRYAGFFVQGMSGAVKEVKSDEAYFFALYLHKDRRHIQDQDVWTEYKGPLQGCITLANKGAAVGSWGARVWLYREALEQFISSHGRGVGVGGFGERVCGDSGLSPHSTLLQAFVELGLLGGAAFLAIIVWTTHYLWTALRSTSVGMRAIASLLASLWCFYVLFDQVNGHYLANAGFFLLTGACAALRDESSLKAEQRL